MDAAAERMGALKRAYAEIILNVTKQSAARVLAAERRAMRLQEELAASKEEAIAALLRVKSIMDLKISDTAKASLDQAKRIQDLEALLGESKNTIKSLEAKLNEVKEKMDVATGSMEVPDIDIGSKQCCNQEDPKECSPLSDPIPCSPNCDPVHHSPTEKNSSDYKQSSLGDCYHEISADSLRPKPLEVLSLEKKCCCDPELSPIMMQMKEPDLLRSGRKQRVRAFDQSTLPQEVCTKHEDQPLKSSFIKNGTDPPTEIVGPNIDKCVSNANKLNLPCPVPAILSSSSLPLKKQRKRRKRMRLTSFATSDKIVLSCDSSKNSRNSNQCSHGIHSNSSLVSIEDSDSRSLSCQKDEGPSDTEIKLMETNTRVENANDKEMVTASESLSSLLEASALSFDSDAVDKASSTINLANRDFSIGNSDSQGGCRPFGSLNQDMSNGFLKYTFKRKRMRGTSNSADENIANEQWARTCDKDYALQENQKPGSLRASSCDSRRVAQVARQLVSLSQKRWG